MRLGPLEIKRHVVEAAAQPIGRPHTERGASGTLNLAGFLQQNEYNQDLVGRRGLDIYQKMRLSDPSIRESLWYLFAPLLAATVDVQECNDDPGNLEVAAFARKALFEWPERPFKDFLRQALLYLAQGHQVFELVEDVFTASLDVEDPASGVSQDLPERQFIGWRRLAHRRPETIWKWNTDDRGELVSITQQVWMHDGYENPEIPAENLLVFVNEQEGDDYNGVSLLRSAYKSWWLKERVEIIAGVAYERHGVGVPVAYVPEDAKNDQAMLDRIEAMLAGIKAGEFSYLVMPGPKGPAPTGAGGGNGGFWVEILSPTGGIPDFNPFLTYLRGDIKGNVLARFAELGHGSVGARAVADPQSKIWFDALAATGEYVAATLTDALRRLVDKNYANVEDYPEVVFRDLDARNLAEYATAIAQVVSAGAVIPDKPARDSIRDGLGLPPEDGSAEDQNKPDGGIEEDPTAPPGQQPEPAQNGKPPADRVPAPTYQ